MARYVPDKVQTRLTAIGLIRPEVDEVLEETLEGARRRAPVRSPRPYDRRATGRLRKSLRQRGPKVQITQISGSVGSTLRYAASVHEGSKPHRIQARYRTVLSFWWDRYSVRVAFPRVNHPGIRKTRRKQYLWLPLRSAARRHGFAVRRFTRNV